MNTDEKMTLLSPLSITATLHRSCSMSISSERHRDCVHMSQRKHVLVFTLSLSCDREELARGWELASDQTESRVNNTRGSATRCSSATV